MRKDVVKSEYEQLMRNIKKFEVLSKEEEYDLFIKFKNGDMNARDQIIKCNLRLVASIASYYASNADDASVLFQEGIFGLLRAMEKFDPSRNIKFSTYATSWIKETMYRYLLNDNYIKIPEWIVLLGKRVKRYSDYYYSMEGVYPTNELLSEKFNTSIKNIIIAKAIFNTPISVNNTCKLNNEEVDLRIEIPDKVNIETEATNNILKEEIFELLDNTLTVQEKQVIFKRFGLDDNKYLSVQETADSINLSFNKVITHEKNALRKIRKSGVERFKNYLS